ncbi:O-methyltransferase [Schizopora paradoxa]|uniref:O-methyltransferase n=1 Tax=Schizopora paradoxa TaxID=27342 RepID=A0A0H2SAN0_9AGAM|nr:O-methyltransferase [Schizopora paradoxa]
MTSLTTLAELILAQCKVLDASCAQRGIAIPSLDAPYKPGSDVANDKDPQVVDALAIIASTTHQLLNTIQPAPMGLFSLVTSGVAGAALRAASELNVTEALRDAGEKGLHVDEIAAKCKTHPLKLGVILRVLTSNWVYKEVRPDVFANNRLSSVLDKGQSVEELQAHPENKYTKPFAGLAAGVDHFGDETLKMSAHLSEALSDPAWTLSTKPHHSAFNKAFSSSSSAEGAEGMTLWEWYERPEQKARHDRFKVLMATGEKFDSPELVPNGFEWTSLPDNALVVDVGGGIGNISMQIAKANPRLKVVCQDMEKTVEVANGHWKDGEEKAIVESGRVTFQASDFFAPQPIKHASVYFMKHILHDWADDACLTILRSLRSAAGDSKESKLVVMDKVLPYTCLTEGFGEGKVGGASVSKIGGQDGSEGGAKDGERNEGKEGREGRDEVEGYKEPTLPAPLTNVGAATTGFPYTASLMMMMTGNGQERTIGHFVALFKQGGWKVERVRQFDVLAKNDSVIVAVPI